MMTAGTQRGSTAYLSVIYEDPRVASASNISSYGPIKLFLQGAFGETRDKSNVRCYDQKSPIAELPETSVPVGGSRRSVSS